MGRFYHKAGQKANISGFDLCISGQMCYTDKVAYQDDKVWKAMTSVADVINKYHIWDARKISELLPGREFIDVTITSPPYWKLKDYGVEPQIGFGQKYDPYLDDVEKVFHDIYSMTKKTGSLWIISDTLKHRGEVKLLPFDLAQRLKRMGWILQDIIIWNKDKTLPWSHEGKLRNIFEYILFFSKRRKFKYHLERVRDVTDLKEWWVRYPERYSPQGKAPARTWYIPIPRQGSWGKTWVRHFNPLPPELVERILLLTTDKGNVVLDPFCGSGAVLAQAYAMGRGYIGLDINPKYREMFERRVLPYILGLQADNAKKTLERKKKKRVFGRLIRSLRKTKYPKQLVRLYKREYGPLDLEAILALQASKDNPLKVIFLFPRTVKIPPDFLSRVVELSKRPPLSKYGIKAVLTAHSVKVVSRAWLEDRGLSLRKRPYVYAGGRTYAWAERVTVKKWLGMIKKGECLQPHKRGYPPIVSDIAAKVDLHSPPFQVEEGR